MKTLKRGKEHANCRDLLLWIARSVDNDLGPAERRTLAQHLRGCRRCGAFSKDLRRTVALFRGLGREPLTPRARARARANVARLLSRSTTK